MRKIKISQPSINLLEKHIVSEVLNSLWLAQGVETEKFETEFATYHDAKHGIAISSCTTGIELALKALNIGADENDEVIVPCFSWVATASSVAIVGAKPIFVDIDDTYNTNIDQILKSISPNTKAVIPVHLFGKCIDIKELRERLPHHIKIIEDAACASGSTYQNFYPSKHSDCAVFSFHPRKVITTGEGGMILTNDQDIAKNLRKLRNHGQCGTHTESNSDFKYISDVDVLAHNYRMTDIQSSIGRVQLAKLKYFIDERYALAQKYIDGLKNITWIKLPKTQAYTQNGNIDSWQSFVICVEKDTNFSFQNPNETNRNALIRYLAEQGIETRPGTQFIPKLKYYQDRYFKNQDVASLFPIASFVFSHSISLPIYNGLTETQIEDVIQILQAIETR